MSDDLNKLKAALKAQEPAPDAGRRAEALARAMAEFDRVQGSAERARHTDSRPERAEIWNGVTTMLNRLTTRAALAGTASVAVLGFGIFLTLDTVPPAPQGGVTETLKTADARMVDDSSAVTAAVTPEADALPEPAEAMPAPAPEAEAEPMPAIAAAEREVGSIATPESSQTGIVAEESAEAMPQVERFSQDLDLEFSLEGELDQGLSAGVQIDLAEPAPRASAPTPSVAGTLASGRSELAPRPSLEPSVPVGPDTEAFPEADRNPLKVTAEEPVSTFSIDVDTASYAVVRSSLNAGRLPPEGAVRIEEMVNYFPYDWPTPDTGEAPFRPSVQIMPTPWNEGTRLVTVALQGRAPAMEERPALNLVFLIDTSGSMQDTNKLPLLKQSFRLMLSELRPEDRVSIVTYAGSAGRVLDPTPAAERETILAALDRLSAGGSTAGQQGLALAYETARSMVEDGEVTRVLLATDGDFNVGISDPEALKDYIAREREAGVYLSVLGFGRGNLDDATMQALAQNGNGTAAYIDTLNEARKVLVDQLSGALFPIADDVKIQVEWNPATVAEYRLIGYETRALAREDFSNDKVDAGEIGAGHSVTAIYEITPVGSPTRATEPLRYGASAEAESADEVEARTTFADELGFLRLRYKEPGKETSQLIETPILTAAPEAGVEARFAVAIAGMGQLLTDDRYLGDWGWGDAISLATDARGDDPFGYRAEAIQLMRLAEILAR